MAENTAGQTLVQDTGSDPVMHVASGSDVFDATAIVAADFVRIRTGFRPKYVVWDNVTDRIMGVHYKGMADNSCVKTAAAGTRTLEVTGGNGGITLQDDGFQVLQNATLALILANKTCRWTAVG